MHALPIIDATTFQDRLTALEEWLWTQGPAALRLGASQLRMPKLAQAVKDLSDLYTTSRDNLTDEDGGQGHLLAKTFYFLCSDAPKVHLVLDELARRYGQTPDASPSADRSAPLTALDLGAGVGATGVGLLLSLDAARCPSVRLTGADMDGPALRRWLTLMHRAAEIAGIRLQAQTVEMDLMHPMGDELPRSWDIALAQGLVNELFAHEADDAKASELQAQWLQPWTKKGLLLALEPALKTTTRRLQMARDRLLAMGSVRVLAPCPHAAACPMLVNPRHWCHEVRLVEPTPMVAQVQAVTRRRDDRVKYSFLALTAKEPGPAEAATGDASWGRLVSDSLRSKGKIERLYCGADARLVQLRLLDKERTQGNALLDEASRGELVRLSGEVTMPRLSPRTQVTSL
ncbi:MAG: hypothetical protein IT440_09455 [Phycisphaeraceae bacterium]|nr:hypothetical protein [Phycisphaeraceae bacterium]